MRNLIITGAFLLASLAGAPRVFAVTTYHYTCADFSTQVGVSCTGSTATFTNAGDQYAQDDGQTYAIGTGTWYLTVTVSGYSGSGSFRSCLTGQCGGSTLTFTTTQSDTSFTASGTGYLALENTSSGAPFAGGVLTDICVSDTVGQCTPAPPPAPAGVATSSVDQTQRNVWQAWWVFFGMFCVVLWLGRSYGR